MKKILFFFIITTFSFGQTQNQKVKVLLLGTFHFGATSDRNSTKFDDLFSEKRQKELDSLAHKLNAFGVDKFFVENQFSEQKQTEELFAKYKAKEITNEKTLKNEIFQIAYRTAVLNNAKLVAADFEQELPYDKIKEYEMKHNDDKDSPYSFFDAEYPFKEKRKKLVEVSLMDYYIQLNNLYSRQATMYDYLHYALAYGEDNDFTGENFTSVLYDRNLKIFTNILRNIDLKTDKTIVVLMGASHTAFLRQFFENHPYFEIVELETVFK